MRRRSWVMAAAFAVLGATGAVAAGAAGQTSSSTTSTSSTASTTTAGSGSVLRIGWAQEAHTLNVFTGQDEEDYNVWALNFDLLVNFSPKDLTPSPGIAKSWDISPDKKTITFHLIDGKWSDGKPITSADVKYSLNVLGGNGALFTSYTDNITKIGTPDEHTVVIHTKRPDARIVGGLFIYIIPKHIWGKVPVKTLTGSYQAKLPLVGSGPYTVTKYDPGHIVILERNPYFRGPAPGFDQIQFIKYGTQDAVERALQLGEVDADVEVQASSWERLSNDANITTVKSQTPAYTQLTFNSCSKDRCPDASYNPAVQDTAIRQAVAYAVDRNRINEIAARGTSYPGEGILPSFYKSFFETPDQDYSYDPDKARQILDAAGWQDNGSDPRTKGGETASFNLYVRSESAYDIQAAKLVAEEAGQVGIHFNVQVVSTDKLYGLTTQKQNGKPAPDYDTFIWGWGGDPYDPSFLLSILTSQEAVAGGSSDSYFSNRTYDRLFKQQAGEFDTAKRRDIIHRMVGITQHYLPYLVLTYDPNLQAYRSDAIANVSRQCPEDDRRHHVRADGLRAAADDDARQPVAGSSTSGGGESAGLAVLTALVVRPRWLLPRRPVIAAGASASRWSWRSEDAPVTARWLAGKVAAALVTLAFVLIFNFFLFRVMGDPTNQLAKLPQSTPKEIEAAASTTTAWTSRCSASSPTTSATRSPRSRASARPAARPVWDEIKDALPWTLLLVGVGTVLATLLGSWMGVVAATRRGTTHRRRAARLQPVHLRRAGVLDRDHPDPRLRRVDTDLPRRPADDAGGELPELVEPGRSTSLDHLILPVTAMTLMLLGQYFLIMRSSMVDVLTEDFITVKRATGLPWHRVVRRHAVPNALLPLVTLSAIQFGAVAGGAITIETIFSWPGLGELSFEAINDKDFPVLQGTFLVFSVARDPGQPAGRLPLLRARPAGAVA